MLETLRSLVGAEKPVYPWDYGESKTKPPGHIPLERVFGVGVVGSLSE